MNLCCRCYGAELALLLTSECLALLLPARDARNLEIFVPRSTMSMSKKVEVDISLITSGDVLYAHSQQRLHTRSPCCIKSWVKYHILCHTSPTFSSTFLDTRAAPLKHRLTLAPLHTGPNYRLVTFTVHSILLYALLNQQHHSFRDCSVACQPVSLQIWWS